MDTPEEYSRDRLGRRLEMADGQRQRVQQAAQRLRRTSTVSERILWEELRNRKLGVKFRRQHPIGSLVVDFCCPQLHLVVEIDGPVHQNQIERVAARQSQLEAAGYHVLVLRADEVEDTLESTLDRIKAMIQTGAVDSLDQPAHLAAAEEEPFPSPQ